MQLRDEEINIWDAFMMKELKSIWYLVLFKMALSPSGANILASTWDFYKKIYPYGDLKKVKDRVCVRGDQQIDGLYVF